MLSVDSNLLLYACDADCPEHKKAYAFIESLGRRDDVAISELVLMELYVLLRNEAVVGEPLSASDAVEIILIYRRHPRWRLVGFPKADTGIADAIWRHATRPDFPRRRVYDVRLALTLLHHGVTDFATRNTKDFQGLGFRRVWDPLSEPASARA